MPTSWSGHEGLCVDCGVAVHGARLVGGVCPSCAEEPPTYVLTELVAYDGQRYAQRVQKAPRAPQPGRTERAFGRILERRAKAEADLRWFYQQADGDLGIRAICISDDLMAPASLATVRNDSGVWKAKPTRSIIVRGMTMGQLAAAHRCRRVTRILRSLSRDHGRILQRRYDLIYYASLEIPFGEWSGIVDFLNPSVAILCRPREGKGPDTQLVLRYTEQAKQAYAVALAAYMKAT